MSRSRVALVLLAGVVLLVGVTLRSVSLRRDDAPRSVGVADGIAGSRNADADADGAHGGAHGGPAAARAGRRRVRDRRVLDVEAVRSDRAAGLSGVVVDDHGRPVDGATVAALRTPPAMARIDVMRTFDELARPLTPDAATRTRPDGTFRLADLAEGTWTLVASRPPGGSGVIAAAVVLAAGSPPVRIVVPPGLRLEGRVEGPPGIDPERLTVVLAPKFEILAPEASLASRVRAPVAADGTFCIDGLAAREWTIAVVAGSWIAVRDDDLEVPTDDAVTVLLPTEASLSGLVTSPDGAPVAGAAVCHVDGGWFTMTRTASDGSYHLPALRAGRPDFFAVRAPGFAPWPAEFRDAIYAADARTRLTRGPNVLDVRLARAGSASGVVVERGSGRPVAGAVVRAASMYMVFGGAPSAVTDADGRFALDDLPSDCTVFVASKDGWAQPDLEAVWRKIDRNDGPAEGMAVPGAPGAPGTPPAPAAVRIELVPAPVLRGRVVSPAGAAVGGAFVRGFDARAEHRDILDSLPFDAAPCTADADGWFEIPLPAAFDEVIVEARAAGFHAGRTTTKPADAREIEVRLLAGAGVAGRVTAADGTAVSGATITCRSKGRGAGEFPPSGLVATTDADGRFGIADLAAGKWTIDVAEPRHVRESSSVEIEGGVTAAADFELDPAIVVAGRVLRPDGGPAARADLVLRRGDGDATEQRRTAAADGSFRFESVPAGTWNLEASASAAAPSEPIPIDADASDLEIRLVAVRAISGTVRWRGGGPAEGLYVTLERADGDRTRCSYPVAAGGSFSAPGLAAASYWIGVQDPQGGPWSLRPFAGPRTARAGTGDLELVVQAGFPIAGVVVFDDDTPADGARVACVLADTSAPPSPDSERPLVATWALADAPSGRFRFDCLAPGSYRVTACAADGTTASLVVVAGDTRVQLRLCPGETLYGRVVGGGGAPVAGVQVAAWGGSGSQPAASARTDAAGRFEIGPLPCGRYEFAADGFVRVTRTVSHAAADGEIVITTPATPQARAAPPPVTR